MGLQVTGADFGGGGFFLHVGRTLSNLLRASARSLPLPFSPLWSFCLKLGEDAPWFFGAQKYKVTKFEQMLPRGAASSLILQNN